MLLLIKSAESLNLEISMRGCEEVGVVQCNVSGSCEKTLIDRTLKIVVSQRGQNLLYGLRKSGNKLVVMCNSLWLN
jgi:hypothetical protein